LRTLPATFRSCIYKRCYHLSFSSRQTYLKRKC